MGSYNVMCVNWRRLVHVQTGRKVEVTKGVLIQWNGKIKQNGQA